MSAGAVASLLTAVPPYLKLYSRVPLTHSVLYILLTVSHIKAVREIAQLSLIFKHIQSKECCKWEYKVNSCRSERTHNLAGVESPSVGNVSVLEAVRRESTERCQSTLDWKSLSGSCSSSFNQGEI